MSIPKVSITVPVYNAEKYLSQCIDSLLCQTLKELEIVIVNDGSTDGSLQICEEYARKDTRIKLVNKENEGSASARQAALDASTGEYVCSCDADDWMEPIAYEKLYNKAKETNADIVVFDSIADYSDGRQVVHRYGKDPNESKDLLDDAINGRFPISVCFKMIKRDIFRKYNLIWEKGINLGEDYLMTLKILQNKVKVAYLPYPLYHYRRIYGGSSYTNNITMNTFSQIFYVQQWILAHVDNSKYANGIFRGWIQLGFAALRVKDGMTAKRYRKEILNQMSYVGFLKYNYPTLKGLLVLSGKIFGYNFAKYVYNLMYKYVYR